MNSLTRVAGGIRVCVVIAASCLSACVMLRPSREQKLPWTHRALVHGFIENVARREASVDCIQARTKFTLDSPDLARRVSIRGFVAFAHPDKLRVQGHAALGIDAFDLISIGKTFVLDIPSEEKVFYAVDGMDIESVPFTVSPGDIARELFRPIDWEAVDADDLRVARKSPEEAVFEYRLDGLTHRIAVDSRWLVTRRDRYDDGQLTCTALLSNYTNVAGTPFARRVELLYPPEQTRLEMRLSRIRLNRELSADMFRLPDDMVRRIGRETGVSAMR